MPRACLLGACLGSISALVPLLKWSGLGLVCNVTARSALWLWRASVNQGRLRQAGMSDWKRRSVTRLGVLSSSEPGQLLKLVEQNSTVWSAGATWNARVGFRMIQPHCRTANPCADSIYQLCRTWRGRASAILLSQSPHGRGDDYGREHILLALPGGIDVRTKRFCFIL